MHDKKIGKSELGLFIIWFYFRSVNICTVSIISNTFFLIIKKTIYKNYKKNYIISFKSVIKRHTEVAVLIYTA